MQFERVTDQGCHRCLRVTQKKETVIVDTSLEIESYGDACAEYRKLRRSDPRRAASCFSFYWQCLACGANGSSY